MSKPYRDFEPKWYHGEVPPTSYRSIFKWGAPDQIKPPKESLYKLVKEKFGLTDADFGHYTENLGLDAVRFDLPCTMEQRRLDAFRDIAVSYTHLIAAHNGIALEWELGQVRRRTFSHAPPNTLNG